MFSSPDPSCSGLKKNGKPCDEVTVEEAADLNTDLDPLFIPHIIRIRDYVFNKRRDNINTTWPFSKASLQFLQNNDVDNVLPPIETPDVIRKRFLPSCLGSDPLRSPLSDKDTTKEVGCVQVEPPTQEQNNLCEFDDTSGSEQHTPPTPINDAHYQGEPVQDSSVQEEDTSNFSVEVDNWQSLCPSEEDEGRGETSGKKCRLVFKLNTVSDPSRTDGIIMPNTAAAAASDPMASKVCPVCKSFSSTSNTTLNAHIDQCLSVESTSKWVTNGNKSSKHRIKPRKKKLMVDIYKTASRCTLEELDRRNGTNWAADSSLPNAESEVSAQGKRQRMCLEDKGDENPVFLDSTGKKVMILSKFGEASVPNVGEGSRPRKNIKNDKEGRILSSDKKKCFGPNHSKKRKGKSQNKNLCSLDAAKIHGMPRVEHEMDKTCEKEESRSHLQKDHDEINPSDRGTLRQWVCSKRTRLLKRVNGKDGRQVRGSFPSTINNPLIESSKTSSSNSSVERNPIQSTSDPCENVISSLKSKHVDSTLLEAQTNDSGTESPEGSESELHQLTRENTSCGTGGCMPKMSRSPGTFTSSPRSKRIEVHTRNSENSGSLPNKTWNPLDLRDQITVKQNRLSVLGNGLQGKSSLSIFKSKESRKRSFAKKSCLHRSIADLAGPLPLTVEDQHDQVHAGKVHRNPKQMGGTDGAVGSSDTMQPETVSFGRSGVLKPRKKREISSHSGREQAVALKSLHGRETHVLDQPVFADSRVRVPLQSSNTSKKKVDGTEMGIQEILFHEDTAIDRVSKKYNGGHILKFSEPLVSEPQKIASFSNSQNYLLECSEEVGTHAYGTAAILPLVEQRSADELKMSEHSKVKTTIGRNTYVAPVINWREGISCSNVQYRRFGTDPGPLPAAPPAFLASLGYMGSDDLQENSTITSSIIMSSQERHLMVDRDSSGSPVSGASIISNPTAARADSKYLDPVSSVEHPEAQVKFISGVSDTRPFTPRAKGVERIDSNAEELRISNAPTEGFMKFTTDQPCCCSRKESFSLGASQFLEHRSASSAMPTKGKQMTYTNNKPSIFISPSSGSVSRNSETTVPLFALPSDPFSEKPSCNAAQKITNQSDLGPGRPSSQVQEFRLMGKNLMVVNKDEDAQLQSRQPPQVSSHMAPQSHAFFSHDSWHSPRPQYFGVGLGGLSHSKTHQTHPKELAGLVGSSYAYSVEKMGPNREVIVIDDSPEDGPTVVKAKYADGENGSQPSPVGVLPPSGACSNLRQMNAFSCHSSSNPFSRMEAPGGLKPYLVSSPLKWGSTSDGSGMSMRSPFMPTPSTSHVRRPMYQYPNLH